MRLSICQHQCSASLRGHLQAQPQHGRMPQKRPPQLARQHISEPATLRRPERPTSGRAGALVTDLDQEVEVRDVRLDSWELDERNEPPPELQVREASHMDDFEAIGWLRARAYYEVQEEVPGRFQGSFIKQFAEQEARSLVERTRPAKGCSVPEAVCLIVSQPPDDPNAELNSGDIIATADVKPPAIAGGQYPRGVPEGEHEDELGAYILNVVVGACFRRSGCGKIIMTSAEEVARHYWGATRVYAHVSQDNAVGMYCSARTLLRAKQTGGEQLGRVPRVKSYLPRVRLDYA